MQLAEELSVSQVATYLKVNEETVRRNIRAKRLQAIRRGTQWFVSRDDLIAFANGYDPRTGKVKHML